MKIPLIGSLGINTETGVILAVAGIAAFALMHGMGAKDIPPATPVSKGPKDIIGLDTDMENFNPQHIGWTVPFAIDSKSNLYGQDTRGLRKNWPAQEDTERAGYEVPHPSYGGQYPQGVSFINNPKVMVSNPGYHADDSSKRMDGTVYMARSYETNDVTTTTTTPPTTDPAVVGLQDRILKMITSRTNNVTTILANLETIKAEIQTYTSKLQLALQQVTGGLLTQAQLSQYLDSIVTEIATKLKITLTPGFGDNSVPDYYQQYYQDYQKYTNQLNSNYYDYYQPSYQYYPGQQYNYYQPYQYQYPSPYYPSGQYPTNYPSYNYNSGYGQYPRQPQVYVYYDKDDYYHRRPKYHDGKGNLISIGANGIQIGGSGGISIGGSGSGNSGGGFLSGLLGGIFG